MLRNEIFKGARSMTEEQFDKVKYKVLMAQGNYEKYYDDFLDKAIEVAVKGTIKAFFQDNYLYEDALQDVKLIIMKKIYQPLMNPKTKSREQLEAWMVTVAKHHCCNLIKKREFTDLEFKGEITGEDIERAYEGLDTSRIYEVLEYLWNINTEPAKNIMFILTQVAVEEVERKAQGRGRNQIASEKYAPKKLSPVTGSSNPLEDILKEGLKAPEGSTCFGDAVLELDRLLREGELGQVQQEWFKAIVKKLNAEGDKGKPGDRTLSVTVRDSKSGKNQFQLRYDENNKLIIDMELIKQISDYITKGNNRISKNIKSNYERR